MKNTVKIQNKYKERYWKGLIMPVVLFVCLLVFLSVGIRNVSAVSDKESRQILQDAVLRATVQCYAIEGMYPPDVTYLEDNYGVTYDHDRFIVHYEAFASNIMPDITVVDLTE